MDFLSSFDHQFNPEMVRGDIIKKGQIQEPQSVLEC
jgi:hypothetical protein